MKVFISWSGPVSRQVGTALADWLPSVLQAAEPFISEKDIAAGEAPMDVLFRELRDSGFCISCLTEDNLRRPWVLFEAGFIAHKLDRRLVPYLWGLTPGLLRDTPLHNWQAVQANEDGTRKLLESLNDVLSNEPGHLPANRLQDSFDTYWPRLQDQLAQIPSEEGTQGVPSSGEVLADLVKGMQRIEYWLERQSRSLAFRPSEPLLQGLTGAKARRTPSGEHNPFRSFYASPDLQLQLNEFLDAISGQYPKRAETVAAKRTSVRDMWIAGTLTEVERALQGATGEEDRKRRIEEVVGWIDSTPPTVEEAIRAALEKAVEGGLITGDEFDRLIGQV